MDDSDWDSVPDEGETEDTAGMELKQFSFFCKIN